MTLPDKIRDLPCWTGTPSGAPLSGGLSNEIWKVSDDAGDHVVRFGTDYPMHHVDRARELMSTRAAHAAGFCPGGRICGPRCHGHGLCALAHVGGGGYAGQSRPYG